MNCSIVYCFTTPASAGLVFFGSGVCLVSRALFDTSGFRSSRGFWAHPDENARAASTEITDSNVTFFEFMDFVLKFAYRIRDRRWRNFFARRAPRPLVKAPFAVYIPPWAVTRLG